MKRDSQYYWVNRRMPLCLSKIGFIHSHTECLSSMDCTTQWVSVCIVVQQILIDLYRNCFNTGGIHEFLLPHLPLCV